MTEQDRGRGSGKFTPTIDKDDLHESIESGTLALSNSGRLPVFTATEIAHRYNDGQHSTRTIKRRLKELEEDGKVVSMKISRHSEQPITVWFSPALKFNLKVGEFDYNHDT